MFRRVLASLCATLGLILLCRMPATAAMPNHALTPGDVAESNTAEVCSIGDAERRRSVSYRVRDRVYLSYGIPRGQRKGRYRIDHLIPLELGGSNLPSNLWPQPFDDSKLKDRVESELHDAVCSGAMKLGQAQQAIARDWHTAVPADFKRGGLAPPDLPITGHGPVSARSSRPCRLIGQTSSRYRTCAAGRSAYLGR